MTELAVIVLRGDGWINWIRAMGRTIGRGPGLKSEANCESGRTAFIVMWTEREDVEQKK